jgi:autotransporter-associated beta strand protein
MRARRVVWPTLAAAVSLAVTQAHGQSLQNVLGVTHIDGQYFLTNDPNNPSKPLIDYVDEGANQVLDTGSTAIKLELNPSKYDWLPAGQSWPAFTSLAQLEATSYFQSVFSKPFKTYVMTAYQPSIPGGGDPAQYWLNGMTAAQKAAEQTGFYNAAKYLMQTYNGTGKTFIFEQWEGDWALRSGVVSRNTQPTATNVQGMIDWINARQAGILQARAELASQTDVKVYGTLEVNKVADAINGDVVNGSAGWATVTNDVLPHTTVDFASYSSYDTQQITSGATSYANAVQYIASKLPPTAVNGQNTHSVYVGEYGLAEDSAGAPTVASMMNNVISTAKADGMPYAFYWEVYSNEVKDSTATPAPIQQNQDSAVRGFYFIKPDGTPATAFQLYMQQFAQADPNKANNAGAVRAGVKLAYASKFTAPGATLGPEWSTNNAGGNMSVAATNGAVTMQVTGNAANFPAGLATLNIDTVAGRGLNPGEYIELNLQRNNANGFVGVQVFGENHGSGSTAGSQPFDVFVPTTAVNAWLPVSFASDGSHPSYNWDTQATLGIRLDAADGHFATVSYYINGNYAGSWEYPTTSTKLDNISLFAQSGVLNSTFTFNNVAVYTVGGNAASVGYQWDPGHVQSISAGGAGTWDSSSTGNFYNGTGDVTWNNANLGDSVVFAGNSGTVTVAAGGVVGSRLTFNSPNYVVSGGTITMMGNQTINATNGAATFNNVIAGNNGLTITGAGSVTLGGSNAFTGGLYVNGGGTASFAADANLGAAGQPVILDNGTLKYTGTNAPTTTRAFTLGAGGGTINTVNSAGTGKLVINGNNLLNGSGSLTKTGPGWLTIYGSNATSFTGTLNINGGVVELGGPGDIGSGAVTVNNTGELSSNITNPIPNAITVNAGSTLSADFGTAGTIGTFAGPITANGNFNVRLGNFWSSLSQKVVISGNISGAGTLTTISAVAPTSTNLAGLTLSGNNAGWSGGITIPFGTVTAALSQGNTLGTGRITLAGGKLALAGQITQSGSAGAVAPVAASGYNKDLVYGNPDTGGTVTSGIDTAFGFFQNGFTPATGNLNAGTALSGGIASTSVTSSVNSAPFALQSFTGNNALQIAENQTGTLTLATPSAFKTLSVLATSAFGAEETPTLKITFADGTSVNTTYKAYDWSIGTDSGRLASDVFGAGGVNRYSPTQSPGWDTRPFGVYQTDIDLSNINGVDYSNQIVSSLTFTATGFDTQSRGKTSVFAVSGSARGFATGATQTYLNPDTVSADSSLDVSVSLNAVLGPLTIGANKLSVTSSDTTTSGYNVSFGATTVSGNATFDVAPSTGGGAGSVSLGAVSGAGSITKSNTGTLKFTAAGSAIGGALVVNGGTGELDRQRERRAQDHRIDLVIGRAYRRGCRGQSREPFHHQWCIGRSARSE